MIQRINYPRVFATIDREFDDDIVSNFGSSTSLHSNVIYETLLENNNITQSYIFPKLADEDTLKSLDENNNPTND